MARRRSRLPRILLLLGLAAAVAWAGWRVAPRWLAADVAPGAVVDACRLAPAPRLAERIGRVAVEARPRAPVAGVPSASTCEWTFFGGRAQGRLFTLQSLAAGGVDLSPSDYFGSIATGLEYEFKVAPEALQGLGDAALAAGFDGGDAPQVVVRRGERVLAIEFQGLERGFAIAFAGALAEGL